jgi:solute carrier family 25 (mitochondrial 2-oxodicarboxylate transporter), member 21
VAGTLGGTLATTLNTPFDVVKTRVQAYIPSYPGGIYTAPAPLPYRWTLPALGIIVKQEGFSALYKGFLPKVLRLGPGGGILLLVFDQVSHWMRTYLL